MTFISHIFRFLLLSLLMGLAVARLQKRDTPLLQTVSISLTFDASRRYLAHVNMSPGPQEQSFSFAISTTTGVSTVAGVDCVSCGGVTSYNVSASSTAQEVSGSSVQDVGMLSGSVNGFAIKENCSLMQRNGSGWVYPNQTIVVANQSSSVFYSGTSGILGLGTEPFADTIYASWLSRNPSHANFTYGMALNPPTNSSTDGGVLHFIAPDGAFYSGAVSWKNMTAVSSASINSDWTVDMDHWMVESSGTNISGGPAPAIVDPYFSSIIFPQAQARSIYSTIPGSAMQSNSTFSNIWSVPCNTKLSLSVTFGTTSVTVDETMLITRQGDICVGTIEEWAAASTNEYLFGSSLISNLYLIFIISASSESNSIGFALRSSSPAGLSPGAIAGIALGSVAVIVLMAILAVLIYHVRRKRADRPQMTSVADPYMLTSPATPRREQYASLLRSLSPPVTPDWQSNFDGQSTVTPPSVFSVVNSGTTLQLESDATANLVSPPPYQITQVLSTTSPPQVIPRKT